MKTASNRAVACIRFVQLRLRSWLTERAKQHLASCEADFRDARWRAAWAVGEAWEGGAAKKMHKAHRAMEEARDRFEKLND